MRALWMQSENTQTSVVVRNASAFDQNEAVARDGGAFYVPGVASL